MSNRSSHLRSGRASRHRTPMAVAALCAIVAASGCDPAGDGGMVARAARYELSVGEAVSLVAGAPQLAAEAEIVEAVGELWIDYVLLAEAARRDSTMGSVEVGPLVQQQVERRLILALRDTVIEADTTVTDPELRRLFEEERPGMSVSARHILLMAPEGATTLQQDSVRRLAGRIRQQAASGEAGFEELAREYSQDPGSAEQGGALGIVERGQTIPAIEEAVFSLEPGEVSEVVETPYGFHVFRVDERREPGFEEIATSFRAQVQQRRYLQAESTYIAGILDEAALRPVDEAADLTRRMAEDPGARLSGRAADRPVVEYEGGALTLGEVLESMQTSRADYRSQVVQAPDSVLEDEVLLGIVQRELLLRRARGVGLEIPSEVVDSLTRTARERFVEVATQLGVRNVSPSAGQSPREAVEERVLSILREMFTGGRQIMPLGAVAWVLRKQFPNQVFETGVERAVQRLAETRGTPGGGTGAGRPGGAGTSMPPGPAPGAPGRTGPGASAGDPGGAPPDTSGGG